MGSKLTAIAYHYVRPLNDRFFPGINGLDIHEFIGQLDYLANYYQFVSAPDVIAAVSQKTPLPNRAALLTFDDGLADHYSFVAPILVERKIPAAFFPSAQPVLTRKMLTVHKIHYLLATPNNRTDVVQRLVALIGRYRKDYDLPPDESYIENWMRPGDFDDPPEVNFVKRVLQKGLPACLRDDVASQLFEQIVGFSADGFGDQIYLTTSQIREMVAEGFYFGGHGSRHVWLNTLDRDEQHTEIVEMTAFLKLFLPEMRDWMMTYPHGAGDDNVKQLLRTHGCTVAFNVTPGIADLDNEDPLSLRRLDANDFPCALSAANQWTKKVLRDEA